MASPFPSTPILDTFNRANQNPIAGNWSTPMGGTGFNPMQLSSNAIMGTVGGFNNAWWNRETYGPDCESYATIGVPTPGGACSVLARVTEPGNSATVDGYLATYDGAELRLGKYTNGTWSQVGASVPSPAGILTTGDKIGIRCVGTTIEMWVYQSSVWTPRISTTDTSFPGPGYLAIEINGSFQTFDDFGGGRYVETTGTQIQTNVVNPGGMRW